MQLRICIFLCSIHLLILNTSSTLIDEDKDNNLSSKSDQPRTVKEDIYIDDVLTEGSGGSHVKDDLESSGSGFGPDDEDGAGRTSETEWTKKGSIGRHPIEDEDDSIEAAQPPKTPPQPDNDDVHFKSVSPDSATPPRNDIEESRPDHIPDAPRPIDTSGTGNPDIKVKIVQQEDRTTSFFAQPGILAAVIGGAVVGLLCAILVVMFIVYRMRKKDEGSYALEEPKRSPPSNSYVKNSNREFYA